MNVQTTAWVPAPDPSAAPPPEAENPYQTVEDNPFLRYIPMMIMLIMYGVVVMASGLLLRSVSEEKKTRVMEILLLSLSPRQMLSGKIVALGIAGLIQAAAWGVIGYLLFSLGGWAPKLPPGIEMPPSLLGWGVLLFVLGYAVYASLFAGAGALVPNWKESPQVSLLLAVPAFVGFEISLFSFDNPHGALNTAASLFPLTAPFSMTMRLVIGGVPTWQLLLCVGLLLATIPLTVSAVSRMFHAGNLLSGQRFSVKRYFQVLLGRA
jgi:ABC-2 type transport system permease protein